ncbi:glycosyltransferase family 4 protein [Hydrogenobaculum acidophilum]
MPKRKKSITILEARYYHNDNPTIDGHAKMIVKFCELLKNDYNINLITTFKPLYTEVKNIDGIDSVLVKLDDVKDFKDIILESDIMLLTKPDIMLYHPNTYVWIQANYAAIDSNMEALKRWHDKYFTHPYVKKIIFVSPVIEESFLSTSIVPKEKSMVIPNWIESVEKKPKKYEDIKEFKISWVSRLLPEKGWMDLVEALKDTDIKADFIGDGDDFAKAIKLKEEQKLNNINFLGFIKEEPREFINKNNYAIYIFTSHDKSESFGLSLLESMSIGIPCVSSDILPARYVLGSGGLFYNSIKELKDLILKLTTDKQLYNKQAKYSLERAKLFHKDNIKKIWKQTLV